MASSILCLVLCRIEGMVELRCVRLQFSMAIHGLHRDSIVGVGALAEVEVELGVAEAGQG